MKTSEEGQGPEGFASILEEMCMRPGLFTGQPSFLALASYLEGIAFAMSWRGGPNEGPRLSCFGLFYLTGIPGMRESIVQGMKEPLSKCSREIDL